MRSRRFWRDPRPWVALLSLTFSSWALFQDDVINPDGTLYVQAASKFAAGEWKEGFEIYSWPFYSLLIAGTSSVSGIGLEAAAHVLDSLFYVIVSVTFVSIVRLLGASERVVFWSALIVLIYPGLNENRSSVLRDPGYLALYLLALFFFLRYQREPLWRHALGWGLCMTAATLFRMEGVVLLVLVPIVLLVDPTRSWRERFRVFVRAHVIVCAAMAAVLIAWMAARDTELWATLAESRLGRSGVLLGAVRRILFQTLPNRAHLLADTLLSPSSARYAPAVIAITIGAIVVWESFKTLTLLNALLIGAATRFRPVFANGTFRTTWKALLILNVLILVVVAVINFYLTGRSGLALALTLMLVAPFGLAGLYTQWSGRRGFSLRRDWIFPAVCVLVAVTAVDGLVSFSPSKRHIKEAGIWVRENMTRASRVFTNDTILAHYAGTRPETLLGKDPRTSALDVLRDGGWKRYDILAVRVRKKHAELASAFRDTLKREPVKSFRNRGGDEVLVFRVERSSP